MSDVEVVLGALPRLRDALRPRGARGIAGGPVSQHQMRILFHLDDSDPAMVGEVADVMGVTPSTMSLNLKRLEAIGMVARSRDPEDRRVMNVLLTEAGRRLRDATPDFDPARIDAMLLAMRPEDRRRGVEGLALLAEAATRLDVRHREYVRSLTGTSVDSTEGGAE